MPGAERRRHPRHTLRLEGALVTPDGRSAVVTVDISQSGIGFEGGQSVTPGSQVTLMIGGADDAQFSFRGTVVWCVELPGGGLPAYRMGMRTDSIGARDGSVIAETDKSTLLRRILARYADS